MKNNHLKITSFITLFLLINSCIMFSQNKDLNQKVKELKEKGRDSIIKKALKMFDNKINKEDYIISVKANKTSVIVNFHSPVVFLRKNSVYHHQFGCNMIEHSTWAGIISNPHDYGSDKNKIPYYSHSGDAEKHIQIVFDAVNKSDEVGSVSINDFSFDDSMIIRDHKNYYEITVLSPYQESFYKIDKKTAEVYDAGHAH